MLFAAEKALEISGRIQREDLDSNEVYGLALIRLPEIIGEAANPVSTDFQNNFPAIPWKHMISMRN